MSWDAIRETLRKSLATNEYHLWIEPLVFQELDGDVLVLTGPDRYSCSRVEDRYGDMIRELLREARPESSGLRVVPREPVLQLRDNRSGQLQLPGVPAGSSTFRALHPRYTFEHFMVGESNLLASSACGAIARGDTSYGNCLFISSNTGLGKSHLTQAVAHQVLQGSPSARLHYLTAQQFSAEMVKGIRSNTMDRFSRKFVEHCDVLLVEDVHALSGKNKTQEELNTILDYLLKSGKRVVFTSSVAPGVLSGIDEDFKSRMTAGLVTRIDEPDYRTRTVIIRHKAALGGLSLSEELVDYLARNLHGDVRKIESAVLGIKVKAGLQEMVPDMALVKEVVSGLQGRPLDLTGEKILLFVSNQFKVSVKELQSKSRKRHIAYPRQIGMYLTRKYTELSLNDIGQIYNRDHSTVMYAVNAVTKDMSRRATVREQIEFLCRKLKQ